MRKHRYIQKYIKAMEHAAHRSARPARRTADHPEGDWKTHLPEEWRETVEVPLHFRHFAEYEINARRSLGYDADDRPCYTAHSYVLTRLTTDDDEEFYESIAYAEEVAAWRLRDERWLVFRKIDTGAGSQQRGFYAISPDMPR